jgi:hypothetical protein
LKEENEQLNENMLAAFEAENVTNEMIQIYKKHKDKALVMFSLDVDISTIKG